jgi:hypothetical protein
VAKICFAASGSAYKHGVSRADAEGAVRDHRFWIREFDEPRAPGLTRPDLFIGPTRAEAVQLEVMGSWLVGGDLELFHVMPLREKTKRRVREVHAERQKR